MTYITPRRFRSMGLGVDVGERSNAELGMLLEIASNKLDSYCNAPENHSFKGGTIVGEQRIWHPGNTHVPGQRRVWPLHRPIKTITSLSIEVTNGQYIAFTPSNLYIDHHLDTVEITSLQLTPASVFTTGLAPYISLQNPRSKMSYTYGWDFTATDERISYGEATASGAGFFAANQFWTDDDVTVKLNSTALVSGSAYTFDPYEGLVTMTDPITATDVLTVSYSYTLPNTIALATALIGADVVAWSNQMGAGLGGLSGIKVNEVELRASKTGGFANVPINDPVAEMLSSYMYRGFAA
jgi:hypothetical protein